MLEFIYTRTNLPTWLDSKSPDVIVPTSAILGDLQKKLVSCNPPPPEGLREGQKCLYPRERAGVGAGPHLACPPPTS